jgi:hypothetical protein
MNDKNLRPARLARGTIEHSIYEGQDRGWREEGNRPANRKVANSADTVRERAPFPGHNRNSIPLSGSLGTDTRILLLLSVYPHCRLAAQCYRPMLKFKAKISSLRSNRVTITCTCTSLSPPCGRPCIRTYSCHAATCT